MWHDVGHSFLWVWVCVCVSASQIPLSVLARNPHKVHEISYETGRRRGKARSQDREKRGQLAGENSQQKSGEADGQRKATARTCGPRGRVGQRVRVSQRVGISLEYTLAIAHRCTGKPHKSVINFSLLALGANPSPWLFVLLFFHSRLCRLCLVCF